MSTKENGSYTHYLCQNDPTLAKIITYFGHSLGTISKRDPFDSLVRTIISQQLSNSASKSIEARIVEIHGKRPFIAEKILRIKGGELRKCGISKAKIKAINGIAKATLRNELTIQSFKKLSDDEILKKLTNYWGIGIWTAEIFMMFCLKKLDRIALGDSGLQRAHKLLYPDSKSLEETSQKWRPYRAIAAIYLWKFIDSTEYRKIIFNNEPQS